MRRSAVVAALMVTLVASAYAQSDTAKTKPAGDSAKLAAGAAAFLGSWTGSIEGPNGQMPVNAEFKQEGSVLVGMTSSVDGGMVAFREITIAGDTVTAATTMSAQGMSLEVWYTFMRKDDTLNGSASASFNGQSMSFPFTLTRVKPN